VRGTAISGERQTNLNTTTLIEAIRAEYDGVDERVVAAMEAVPRGLFLPGVPDEKAYADVAVYTRTDDEGGFIGGSDQPSQTAILLTLASLEAGQNVLHIGTGTGYGPALIQEIIGRDGIITSMDIDRGSAKGAADLLRKAKKSAVHVVEADGAGGYSQRASYDRIVSSVAVWDIPDAWVRQVRPNGLIITPIYLDGIQIMAAFRVEEGGDLVGERLYSCSFVPITGVAAPPVQHLYMGGGSALRIYSNEISGIDSARLHLLMTADAERCHLGGAPTRRDYWDGFAPYLMMNVPPDYEFATYTVEGSKRVYGMDGDGFTLITIGSATFVGADDLGDTNCYGGADSFLKVDEVFAAWRAAGEPGIDTLRVRLFPRPEETSQGRIFVPETGYLYRRPGHQLHVYMEGEADDDAD
jgi:protein-L-isoaspartate(D-aspartate) O-methyltransferase